MGPFWDPLCTQSQAQAALQSPSLPLLLELHHPHHQPPHQFHWRGLCDGCWLRPTPLQPMSYSFPLPHPHTQMSPPLPARCPPHLQHDANIRRQCLSAIPPCSLAKVFFTDTNTPEDTDINRANRHKAYITEENVKCLSALGSCEIKYCLCVCPAVHVVKLIPILFIIHPHSTPSHPSCPHDLHNAT